MEISRFGNITNIFPHKIYLNSNRIFLFLSSVFLSFDSAKKSTYDIFMWK